MVRRQQAERVIKPDVIDCVPIFRRDAVLVAQEVGGLEINRVIDCASGRNPSPIPSSQMVSLSDTRLKLAERYGVCERWCLLRSSIYQGG